MPGRSRGPIVAPPAALAAVGTVGAFSLIDHVTLLSPLLFVVGIVLLAIFPALNGGTWINALLMGAVLGLVAYGTYDITNLSTLKGWSLTVTLADLAWGTTLTAVSATAGYFVVTLFRL